MSNIIDAISNIVTNPRITLIRDGSTTNRANSMGGALEEYVKDIFANTVDIEDERERMNILKTVFSYLGNQNNPPDSMLIGGNNGDAIEVKKIESEGNSLALNSSYPKAKLFSTNPQLKRACIECESWTKRDMLYAVGVVNESENKLSQLCFVYGDVYCAEKETYEQIRTTIKDGVETIPGVEFAPTKELGRVNRVDPLGITYLRVRGMWGIDNPLTVFNYIYEPDNAYEFNFMCLMSVDKFNSFENIRKIEELVTCYENFRIVDENVKNPNNPVQTIPCKLITFKV